MTKLSILTLVLLAGLSSGVKAADYVPRFLNGQKEIIER